MLSFRLSSSFVNQYRERPEPFGFGALGAFTFYRTYSRVKPDGKYESWVDACERVINGMYSIQKDYCKENGVPFNLDKAAASAQEAFDRLFNLKWSPPGRGISHMGSNSIHERGMYEALQNCFVGEQTFITKEYGVTRFDEVVGEKVTAWTSEGWADGVVSCFGRQPVQSITFVPVHGAKNGASVRSRSNFKSVVTATPDHGWILEDGSKTNSLSVGDVVRVRTVECDKSDKDYRNGYLHGLVFGDGSKEYTYVNGDARYAIRACTERKDACCQSVIEMFDKIHVRESSGTDKHYSTRSCVQLKEFPVGKSHDYIAGFMDGWTDTDGSVGAGVVKLSSSKPGAFEWLKENAANGGYYITGVQYDNRPTTFGERTHPLALVTLCRGDGRMIVDSIINEQIETDVYCVTVPSVGNFALSNGVITSNCSYISTSSIEQHRGKLFSWIMEMLMLGVGVGSDVRGAGKVQAIKPSSEQGVRVYVIPDSREGWAKSLELLIDSYIHPSNTQQAAIVFDYSEIRPAGAPISGFGGVASGKDPLQWMHEQVRAILDASADSGQKISSRVLADIINMIGVVVVAGNVRRSSEILLGNHGDMDFANLKNYEMYPERAAWGWAANNSIIAPLGADYSPYLDAIMNNGEPGFFWRENVNKHARMNGIVDMRDQADGTNPCFAPGTLVQTKSGHYPIEKLVGSTVDVWDGNGWTPVSNFRITGRNQVMLRITMQDGSEIDVTPYHTMILEDGRRIEARNLLPGDTLKESNAPLTHGRINAPGAYIRGFMIGDGTMSNGVPSLWLYGDKKVCGARLVESLKEIPTGKARSDSTFEPAISSKQYSGGRDIDVVLGISARKETLCGYSSTYKFGLPQEVFAWNLQSKLDFVAGLFDSDGSAQDGSHGFGYQMTSTSKQLLLDVQSLLKTIGVQSKVAQSKSASVVDFKDGYGEYKTKDLWRLSIAKANSVKLSNLVTFSRIKQLGDGASLTYQVKLKWNTVASVEEIDEVCESVYCCTVNSTNSFAISSRVMSGNCGEQSLYGYSPAGVGGEMCTLCEVYLPRHTDKYDFYRSLKFAYLYGKTITLLSEKIKHPGTRELMVNNRRIGLSLTGIAQFVGARGVASAVEWMDTGYNYVQHYDLRYSDWFGINRSIRTTSVKPSGSVSLIAGVTPGIHYPHSTYYTRRVRLSDSSHLVDKLVQAGVHVEPSVTSSNTLVASFPVYSGELRPVKDVSIWEQFQMAALAQRHWADNSVSVTINVNPKTTGKDEVKACLDFFQYQLKSVSLLPLVDGGAYAQMPYEEITKEEYESAMSMIDESIVSHMSQERSDGKNRAADMYCDGDACEISAESLSARLK